MGSLEATPLWEKPLAFRPSDLPRSSLQLKVETEEPPQNKSQFPIKVKYNPRSPGKVQRENERKLQKPVVGFGLASLWVSG